MEKTKILIADDHYLVRLGLKTLIDGYADFQVVREVENGQMVLQHINEASYFILDLKMPVLGGLETFKIIKDKHMEKKVILLTDTMDIPTLVNAKKLKPHGFLFKDGMHQEIRTCLDQIKKGNYYAGKNFTSFFKEHKDEIMFVEDLLINLKTLTKTEVNILHEISKNQSTSEIAETMFNSPKTIDNHRTNIARKLAISGYNNLQVVSIKYKVFVDTLYNSVHQPPGKK